MGSLQINNKNFPLGDFYNANVILGEVKNLFNLVEVKIFLVLSR